MALWKHSVPEGLKMLTLMFIFYHISATVILSWGLVSKKPWSETLSYPLPIQGWGDYIPLGQNFKEHLKLHFCTVKLIKKQYRGPVFVINPVWVNNTQATSPKKSQRGSRGRRRTWQTSSPQVFGLACIKKNPFYSIWGGGKLTYHIN